MAEGFGEWKRRDLLNFVAGCAEHGARNISTIAAEIEGKPVLEVRRYVEMLSALYIHAGP